MSQARVILVLALGWLCRAQTPEVTSHEAPITFSSRVNLVSVPVVVRDRNGRALGNLRQEDFQLFDKGKLQVITRFTAEKESGSCAVVEARGRRGSQRKRVPAQAVSLPAKANGPAGALRRVSVR